MTVTAFECGRQVPLPTRTLSARDALINAARSRYTLSPAEIAAVMDRYGAGVQPALRWHQRLVDVVLRGRRHRRLTAYRWEWLDTLADLADRHYLLDVANTCEARTALEEIGEGPWTDHVLEEALTRRAELSDEINVMVQEAQA